MYVFSSTIHYHNGAGKSGSKKKRGAGEYKQKMFYRIKIKKVTSGTSCESCTGTEIGFFFPLPGLDGWNVRLIVCSRLVPDGFCRRPSWYKIAFFFLFRLPERAAPTVGAME